jgi:quercetin dioxygenase-like cupin family protein
MTGIQLEARQSEAASMQTKVIHSSEEPFYNVFGPLHQYLVNPADTGGAFAIMRATVPFGIGIPLHSHADPEVFFVLEGLMEVLQYDGSSSRWLSASPGDVICIPGHVKHAIRNSSSGPATLHGEDMQRLLALAAKYNYWIGSPQENEAISFPKV